MEEPKKRTRRREKNGRHQRQIAGPDGQTMWTASEVAARLGLDATTVRRRSLDRVRYPDFPRGVYYSPGTIRWVPAHVIAWLKAREKAS